MSSATAVKTSIVVLASGGGSGFDSIADAVESGSLAAEIRAVICDQPNALVLEKARRRGIETVLLPFERAPGSKIEEARRFHDERVLAALSKISPRFLVMAGYMRIVSPRLIEAFRSERGYSRIVNIHPSLLPAFPGVGGYAQALHYGAKMAGVSVHLVEAEVDSGPICAQEAFAIDRCTHVSEVEAMGKKIEHRVYPEALRWILPEKFEVSSDFFGAPTGALKTRRQCVRPY